MKTLIFRTLALLIALTVAGSLQAQDSGAVKRRMDERLPKIDALRVAQTVGENNRGFLEVRGNASAEERQVVDAENADRTVVYGLIARQTGSSAEAVGRARAKKIAEASSPGLWLQDEGGRWYKK